MRGNCHREEGWRWRKRRRRQKELEGA